MTPMRVRGLLVGVSCSLLLAGVTPLARVTARAAPADEYRVQMVYRVGKSLKPFHMIVRTVTGDSFGMWYATELVREGGRWTTRQGGVGGVQSSGGTAYPHIYGVPPASSVPQCQGEPGCSNPDPLNRGAIRFSARPVATTRYYIASTHNEVKIELDTTEWRVKDVRDVKVRAIQAAQSDAVGVGAAGRFVEHFRSATAQGGRYGSEVFAAIPCDFGGTGSARLVGRGAHVGDGIAPAPITCSPRGGIAFEFAFTRHQTSWRLEGDVKGVGIAPTRLFVLDYPKP